MWAEYKDFVKNVGITIPDEQMTKTEVFHLQKFVVEPFLFELLLLK
jgi:hypothetical protein